MVPAGQLACASTGRRRRPPRQSARRDASDWAANHRRSLAGAGRFGGRVVLSAIRRSRAGTVATSRPWAIAKGPADASEQQSLASSVSALHPMLDRRTGYSSTLDGGSLARPPTHHHSRRGGVRSTWFQGQVEGSPPGLPRLSHRVSCATATLRRTHGNSMYGGVLGLSHGSVLLGPDNTDPNQSVRARPRPPDYGIIGHVNRALCVPRSTTHTAQDVLAQTDQSSWSIMTASLD